MKENQSFTKAKNSGSKQILKDLFNVKFLPKDSDLPMASTVILNQLM
jgi:hypothetical protein